MIVKKLMEMKAKLVEQTQFEFDEEGQIEYLIEIIDYMIQGKIPISEECLELLGSEITITSSVLKKSQLLKLLNDISLLKENL